MNELEIARTCANTMYAADKASQGIGIRVEVIAVGHAEASVAVTADMLNGFDVCHGGYVFMLADTAFASACNAYDKVTVAGGASIDFLRPGKAGDRLLAVATERFRGGRSGIYDVTVSNQDGEEIAVFTGRSVATGKPILSADRSIYDTK